MAARHSLRQTGGDGTVKKRRTFFVPLIVLACFFLLGSVALVVLGTVFDVGEGERYYRDRLEQASFALERELLQLRMEKMESLKERLHYTVCAQVFIGAIILGWAFDRRRLVLERNKLIDEGPDRETVTPVEDSGGT